MRRLAVALLATTITTTSMFTMAASASAAQGDVAVGSFHSRDVTGYSVFKQQATTIQVVGKYTGLKPNRPYFTVIYSNNICDPAQAFPIGPFFTDHHGNGWINQSVANPNGISVGGTMSVSVRRGDNQSDIDHDGLLGPTDVVAVPGNPPIGLIHCDGRPTVF
jgi:hypothetical protein